MKGIYEQIKIAESKLTKQNKLRILARPNIFKMLIKDSIYEKEEYKNKATLFGWELRVCCMEETIQIVEVLSSI